MADLQFVLLTSAIVLFSAISVAATDTDKKGYEVTTAVDGNKLGIAFSNVYEDTNGGPSIVALDSTKSSIHRLSLPLSQSSAVEHISGGNSGYRDGSTKEALFNQPKKLTVDSDGTIYVADTKNAAVRMITRAGLVTTIAGGSNRTGHNDGEGSEVTFSNDFDVTYLRSTCSLAVTDRGNRMIREIQLPQFIGRCGGATPNAPGSTFTDAALLMSLLAGIAAGAILTILMISARWVEQVQSKLCCWAGNHRRSQPIDLEEEVRSLLLQRKVKNFQPPSSLVKNFQPASSQVKNNLILADLIDLEPAAAITSEGSVNGESSTATVSGMFDSTPAVVERTATVSGMFDSTPAVERVLTIDSMVEKCLAELAAPSPQVKLADE